MRQDRAHSQYLASRHVQLVIRWLWGGLGSISASEHNHTRKSSNLATTLSTGCLRLRLSQAEERSMRSSAGYPTRRLKIGPVGVNLHVGLHLSNILCRLSIHQSTYAIAIGRIVEACRVRLYARSEQRSRGQWPSSDIIREQCSFMPYGDARDLLDLGDRGSGGCHDSPHTCAGKSLLH